MNVLLIVVDSLRKSSLRGGAGGPATPFLDRFSRETVCFERAYATECWTLPSHLSMFTGLLPSEHGAHFQSIGYAGAAPTIAELLGRAGHHTEIVTRNSIFDGTLSGVNRGFAANSRPLAPIPRGLSPFLLVLALAKPRVRRLIRSSGFFHRRQKESVEFRTTLARMGLPADGLALERALEVMGASRRTGKPYFLFLNLYDVHAPYCPSERSALRSLNTPGALLENLSLPWVLPKVSSHAYLRPGFRIADRHRRMLLARYHRAIELMDRKLERFVAEARGRGLLDDTIVIVTSDHGEAFGEHGLYLHDASVYDTHLHVPLWVHHPSRPPEVVQDVVSTRELFGLMRCAALDDSCAGTILDPAYRRRHPIALAEHFHYPHTDGLLERFRVNQAAAITRERKVIVRGDRAEIYDLSRDPLELEPERRSPSEAIRLLSKDDLPSEAQSRAAGHLVHRGVVRRAA